MLDRIERSNYFLIPLDPTHDWYRYHHLFGELLRHELERRQPGRVAELHDRAGRWFLDAGLVSDAIEHLTAAGELDEVSELISSNWLAFTNVGQRETVARWLDAPASRLHPRRRPAVPRPRREQHWRSASATRSSGGWTSPSRRRGTTPVTTRRWRTDDRVSRDGLASCSATCARPRGWRTTRAARRELLLALDRGECPGRLGALVRRQRRRRGAARYGAEARNSEQIVHGLGVGARSARPDRGRSRGLAGMRRPGRGRRSTWSAQMDWRSTGSAAWRTSHGGDCCSTIGVRRGPGRAGARGQPRPARRWGGRVGLRSATLAELLRELGDRRAARELRARGARAAFERSRTRHARAATGRTGGKRAPARTRMSPARARS